jgi:peptidoglycan/xylan/chitin deacetylase (PgdA/CDA1 family)
MLKHFVRDAWLEASFYTGVSQLYNAVAGRKRGIISYHNVLPINNLPPFDTYNVDVTAEIFDRQLVFLKKHFKLLDIHQLANPAKAGFFLTVDDGMFNNHEVLLPMLQKHNLNALFAVCPAMIDGELPYIWRDFVFLLLQKAQGQSVWLPINDYQQSIEVKNINQLTRAFKAYIYRHQVANIYELIADICERNNWTFDKITNTDSLRYDFMNWQQIKNLIACGHKIASHTLTHRVLKFLPDSELHDELYLSKKRIETQLNQTIDTLVFPYGSVAEIDNRVTQKAAEVGYKTALMNVQSHHLAPAHLSLPRFALPPIATPTHLYGIVSGYKFLHKKRLPF